LSAAAVTHELCHSEDEGKEACGQASHGEHEGEPAGVGVRALMGDAAEERDGQQGGENSCGEDADAGAEKRACVWLHRVRSVDQGLHGIDDDSRDGDVEPDREGIAGEPLVRREATGERQKERDEDERERDDGEKDMRGEELPVEGPPGAETVEVSFAVEGEVGQVRDQEDRREEERREHGGAMLRDAAGADEAVAEEQSDGRESVEDGVDEGQGTEVGSADIRWSVEVDEPADEGAGDHADGDDGGDHCRRSSQIVTGRESILGRSSHGGHKKRRRPWAFSMSAAIRSGR
jgi:hypothetical protein